ncbi:MAG: HU family DNA-binding protein [Candidatus Marinimicrobia bacterium]|nr:HU family DNA-binding protein [Candidatus Neomarinimicrobiota bacterium]
MTKEEIVNTLYKQTGMKKEETKVLVDGFLTVVAEALKEGKRIDFRGFGHFEVKIRKPRKGRIPGTGKEIDIPERAVPVFQASDLLKEAVDKEYKSNNFTQPE